jgi:hypothetical protein
MSIETAAFAAEFLSTTAFLHYVVNLETNIAATAAATTATVIYLYRKFFNMTDAKCPVSGSTGKCPFSSKAATSYPNAAKMTKVGVVSSLTGKRSSDGMGLPTAMSQETLDMIVATAPAVAPKMLDITKCFYAKAMAAAPGLLQFFNPAVRTNQNKKIDYRRAVDSFES